MNSFIRVLLIFAAFVAPLGASVLAINTPAGNISFFRMAIFISFGCMLLNSGGRVVLYTSKEKKYSICYFFLLLSYAAVSVFWAKDLGSWARYLFFLCVAVNAIVLYSNYFHDIATLIKPIQALCLGVLLQSLFGWHEVFTGMYLFNTSFGGAYRPVIGQLGIPVAMQFNPNNFALLMFIGTWLAFICFFCCARLRLFYLGLAINFGILAFLTSSRAAIIAYGLAFIYFLIRSGKLKGKLKKIFFLLPILIILILPETVSYIGNTLQFGFSDNHGSDYVRINLIKNGLEFLLQTIGFGVGCGQIPYWMSNYAIYNTYYVIVMHNWWLELLTSFGVVIFSMYIVFYVKLFKYYHSAINLSNMKIGIMICACMIGFVVACVGPSSTMTIEWLWLFWALCIAGQGSLE